LKIHAKKVRLDDDVDLMVIAQKTAGFSGADLNAINGAALLAVHRVKKQVSTLDLDNAVDRIAGGLEKKNTVTNPLEKGSSPTMRWVTPWLRRSPVGSESVHKISIIHRGLCRSRL
jgi:cell division protease FtsH